MSCGANLLNRCYPVSLIWLTGWLEPEFVFVVSLRALVSTPQIGTHMFPLTPAKKGEPAAHPEIKAFLFISTSPPFDIMTGNETQYMEPHIIVGKN